MSPDSSAAAMTRSRPLSSRSATRRAKSVPVSADGTIEFTGFYGDYVVEAAGKKFALEVIKGTTAYELR